MKKTTTELRRIDQLRDQRLPKKQLPKQYKDNISIVRMEDEESNSLI